MQELKLFLRIALAVVIAAIGFSYFAAVLPPMAAAIVGIALGLAEIVAPAFAQRGGAGGSLRVLVRLGASLLAWPGVALLLRHAGLADRPTRVALAAAIASALGVFAAGHGQGREHARLWAVIVAAALPVYALAAAILAGGALGIAVGCLAVGVALLVARQAVVWPQGHSDLLLWASVGVGSVAAAEMLMAVL